MLGNASPRNPIVRMAPSCCVRLQFAGGVPLEGQGGVTTRHPLAVVADSNQPEAPVFDLDGDRAELPASRLFSRSSFTTAAGRSTTSPPQCGR
jgi:hypothetical protein